MENRGYVVAIDLGSNNVVVAVGKRGSGDKMIVEAVVSRPSKGVARGEIKNVEQAAQSIKEAVDEIQQKLGITVHEAYTGISGSHIKCAKQPYFVYVSNDDGEIFPEDVRKLNESMRDVKAPDGHDLLHIIPQLYMVNEDEETADPVGMFGKTLGSTFTLIVGEKVILSRLEKALQKVGIRKAGVFINPLAAAEAVTFPDEKDLGVTVVDMGAGTTDVCIYKDGIVRYIGIIPLGVDAINKDIRSFGIMERYIEELKTKYGCAVPELVDGDKLVKVPGRTPSDHKDISFRNLSTIIRERLIDIFDYVTEEIKAAGYDGQLAAGIVLTGGGANTAEVARLAEERTGYEVRVATPETIVDEHDREMVADPCNSAAVGILAMAIGSGATGGTTAGAPTGGSRPTVKPEQKKEDEEPQEGIRIDDLISPNKKKKEKKEKKAKTAKSDGSWWDKVRKKFETTFDMDVLAEDDEAEDDEEN